MSEKTGVSFIERLSLKYPNQFEIVGKDNVIFPAKNKYFGAIEIVGDLDDWHDEDNYDDEAEKYESQGADYQDYREDISLFFKTTRSAVGYRLTPTEVFEILEQIFADQMVLYAVFGLPSKRKYNGIHKKEHFEKLIIERKIRVGKNYKLCLWSGNFPFEQR